MEQDGLEAVHTDRNTPDKLLDVSVTAAVLACMFSCSPVSQHL